MIFPKQRRKYSILVALLLLCATLVPVGARSGAGDGSSRSEDLAVALPFGPSEELVYEGKFTKALFRGIDIADLRFTAALEPAGATARPQERGAAKSLRLTVDAVSKGLLSKLFGLRFRQHIESTVAANHQAGRAGQQAAHERSGLRSRGRQGSLDGARPE
jgi:hypothetical protein